MRTLILALLFAAVGFAADVPLWDVFEVELAGPASGNPFTEVELSAEFTHGGRSIKAPGFYDGEGSYRIRFMPNAAGEWRYRRNSNRDELDGKTGVFNCTAAGEASHGPVGVRDTFHFAYAEGRRQRAAPVGQHHGAGTGPPVLDHGGGRRLRDAR